MCPCMMQAGGGDTPAAGAIQLSIAPAPGTQAVDTSKLTELEQRLGNLEKYMKRITENKPELLNPPSMEQSGGYRPTARNKKYLAKWKAGKSIGFTMRSSLKAKGLIPRANGTRRVSPKYR